MNVSRTQESVSEMEEQNLDGGDAAKFVPMAESIRYRKRAQSAEKKAETLTEQLAEANQKITQISQGMNDLQIEQKLTHKLVAAGATDLEAAVLMAKARMKGEGELNVDACVEQLRKEKGYLFGGSAEAATSRKTAGAKDRVTQTRTALEQAARKAARTASRADVQHYLKLRRNLL